MALTDTGAGQRLSDQAHVERVVRPVRTRMPIGELHAFALPNLLTYSRILAVPLLVFCFYIEGNAIRWLSFAVFVLATLSDFLDGYLARAWAQQSAIGRILDPIADKILVATALLLLVWEGTIGSWSLLSAIIILTREIAGAALREFLRELSVPLPVSRLAKWKTTLQMVAIGILLIGRAGDQLLKVY